MPVQRGRARLSRKRRLAHADPADLEQLDPPRVHPKFNGGMNRRAARIERSAQRRAALVRRRSAPGLPVPQIRPGTSRSPRASRLSPHARLEEPNAFGVRQTIAVR